MVLALVLTLHRLGNIVPLSTNREHRKRRNGDVVRLDPRVECSIERDIDNRRRPRLAFKDDTTNVCEDPEFVALEPGDVHAGFAVDGVDFVQRRSRETDLLASGLGSYHGVGRIRKLESRLLERPQKPIGNDFVYG